MSLTPAPRHRCLRGIPAWGSLINVKVIGSREGWWRLGKEGKGGSGCSRGGGGGSDGRRRGDACLVLCLCLPVPWWNAESHERGLLFLPPHLSETRIWCPSQKRHCPPPDTLPVSRLNPQLRKHTQQHVRVKTHRCSGRHVGLHTHTDARTHMQMCPARPANGRRVSLKQEQ